MNYEPARWGADKKRSKPGDSTALANLPKEQKEKSKPDEKGEKDADDAAFEAKLDPRLRGLEAALKANGTKVGLTIQDGKVSITVTIADESKSVLDLLKKAGLEGLSTVNVQGNKFTVTGKIAVKKLNALAQLRQVVYISPSH